MMGTMLTLPPLSTPSKLPMPHHPLVLHCQQAMEEVRAEWHFHVHYLQSLLEKETFWGVAEVYPLYECVDMEIM